MNHLKVRTGWKDEIINAHLTQGYGDVVKPLDIDGLIRKYQLFPNEALYIVDCEKAEIEPLSENFEDLIGIDCHNKNDLHLLFDHVHETNQGALHHWVMNNVNITFDGLTVKPEKDIFKCMYQTVQDKVILKITMGLSRDSSGAMRYCLGKLVDLTGLIFFDHFNYKFEGPNKETIYDTYKKGSHVISNLTKRETEILSMLSEGLTSQVIASKLYISVHTVDTHRRNIIDKMETTSALDAFKKCKNLGWL